MRLSPSLYKQNIQWHFKTLWALKQNRKIIDTKAEQILADRGIPVVKPEDLLREKRDFVPVEVVGYKPKSIALDKTHPNWHDRPLLTYRDHNVLLEGLSQAKVLTNTVEVEKGLPNSIVLDSTKKIDARVKEIILAAHVFDAEQKKLPKIKDPNRPAWNFPRVYGITQERTIKLLLQNLLQLIENNSEIELVKQRQLIDDALFSYSFEKYGDLIQFELKGDTLLTSTTPLRPVTTMSTSDFELPDLFPIKPTITLNEENIYEIREAYPINYDTARCHPHTVFIHHDEIEVKNIFEERVTEEQILGRSLLKTFTVAAAYAKNKYGHQVQVLPNPVTVQCVHTNGRLFHFGILQLNTLNLDDAEVKNVWYQTERIPLFDSCCYKVGRPVLENYNSLVTQCLKAFYTSR